MEECILNIYIAASEINNQTENIFATSENMPK